MGQDDVMGILRHVLTTGGGVLVTDGYLSASQSQDAVGAILVLLGIAWSLWNKQQHRQALASATAGAKP